MMPKRNQWPELPPPVAAHVQRQLVKADWEKMLSDLRTLCVIEKTMQQVDFLKKPTLEDYMETDRLTREIARKNVSPKIPPL